MSLSANAFMTIGPLHLDVRRLKLTQFQRELEMSVVISNECNSKFWTFKFCPCTPTRTMDKFVLNFCDAISDSLGC